MGCGLCHWGVTSPNPLVRPPRGHRPLGNLYQPLEMQHLELMNYGGPFHKICVSWSTNYWVRSMVVIPKVIVMNLWEQTR